MLAQTLTHGSRGWSGRPTRRLVRALAALALACTGPAGALGAAHAAFPSAARAPRAGRAAVQATVLGVSQGTGTVYAAGPDGLYRSDSPPYATWRRVNTQTGITAIAPNPTNADELFVVANQVAYHSTDGGATLTQQDIGATRPAPPSYPSIGSQAPGSLQPGAPPPPAPPRTPTTATRATTATVSFLVWPSSPDHPTWPQAQLYAAASDDNGDLYVTTSANGGQNWAQLYYAQPSFDSDQPTGLAAAGDGSAAIVAAQGYHGGGFVVVRPDTTQPTPLAEPPTTQPFAQPGRVFVDPARPQRAWGDLGGFWYSQDGGRSWANASAGLPPTPRVTALDVLSGTAFALAGDGRLYRSSSGTAWAALALPQPLGQSLVVVRRAAYLLATTPDGVWASPVAALAPTAPPALRGLGTWTETVPAAPLGSPVKAAQLANGTVLVVDPAHAQLFEPAHNRWTLLPSPHRHRIEFALVVLRDGRVLLAGDDGSCNSAGTLEIFDPRTGAWTPPMPVLAGRSVSAGVLLRDGRVLLTGNPTCGKMAAEVYDLQSKRWSDAGSLPFFYPFQSLILLDTGDVLAANPTFSANATSPIYAPRSNTWRMESGPLNNRIGIAPVTLPDGTLLAIGGAQESGPDMFPLTTANAYHPHADAWTTRAPLPAEEAFAASALLANGEVLVAGGAGQSMTTDSAALYDPRRDVWLPAHALVHPIGQGGTAVALSDGRALLVAAGATPELFDLGDRPVLPAQPLPGARFVAATYHNLGGPSGSAFLAFYDRYGGLDSFGYPRTEAFAEGGHLVQYTDRFRLERVGGHVVTAPLGRLLTAGRSLPRVAPFAATATNQYFSSTGHSLSGRFLAYWQTHNGALLLGAPISEPDSETNGDGTGRAYLVQWFVGGRLEYHPELAGTLYEVQIGLCGKQALQQRGWLP